MYGAGLLVFIVVLLALFPGPNIGSVSLPSLTLVAGAMLFEGLTRWVSDIYRERMDRDLVSLSKERS